MSDRADYDFRFVPGPLESTRQSWQDFLAQRGRSEVLRADFVPAEGGCFLVVTPKPPAFFLQHARSLVDEFALWLREPREQGEQDVDQSRLQRLQIALEHAGFKVDSFGSAHAALAALSSAGGSEQRTGDCDAQTT